MRGGSRPAAPAVRCSAGRSRAGMRCLLLEIAQPTRTVRACPGRRSPEVLHAVAPIKASQMCVVHVSMKPWRLSPYRGLYRDRLCYIHAVSSGLHHIAAFSFPSQQSHVDLCDSSRRGTASEGPSTIYAYTSLKSHQHSPEDLQQNVPDRCGHMTRHAVTSRFSGGHGTTSYCHSPPLITQKFVERCTLVSIACRN